MKKIVLSALCRTIMPIVILDLCLLMLFAALTALLRGGPKDFSLELLLDGPAIVCVLVFNAWLVWQQQRWFRIKHIPYCV